MLCKDHLRGGDKIEESQERDQEEVGLGSLSSVIFVLEVFSSRKHRYIAISLQCVLRDIGGELNELLDCTSIT